MGRVVILAALRGFRKVIGVEYSVQLAEVARQNVQRAAKRLRCPVEIVNADAQSYPLPDDADLIFMNNPFRGSVLASVIRNIRESIRAHPRKVWIIFVTPDDFERQIQGESWVEKTYEHFFFRRIRYTIYCCYESISEGGD